MTASGKGARRISGLTCRSFSAGSGNSDKHGEAQTLAPDPFEATLNLGLLGDAMGPVECWTFTGELERALPQADRFRSLPIRAWFRAMVVRPSARRRVASRSPYPRAGASAREAWFVQSPREVWHVCLMPWPGNENLQRILIPRVTVLTQRCVRVRPDDERAWRTLNTGSNPVGATPALPQASASTVPATSGPIDA